MSFTVIRRFNLKTNPMKPDNKHLHNIIHIFLKRKIYKNKFEKLTNSTTGLVILSIFSIPSLFLYYYTSSVTSILYWYLFFIQIFLYILIYYYYLKIRKLNSNG